MTFSLEQSLELILGQYQESFSKKDYSEENQDHDLLMDAFGITPELKRENRQYWGRELGMCWQRLVTEVFRVSDPRRFGPAIRIGADEPCDLTFANDAIDTKYRIGSGDSGTLKKFKSYGPMLRSKGYTPVFLIVREDNLASAITACKVGGWDIRIGESSFEYIKDRSGFDIKKFLNDRIDIHKITR